MDSIERLLQDGSPLAGVLAGFSPRPEQLDMARRVTHAIATGRHLAVEAGAGTGKTIAYLLPALYCKRKVVIATATRTLQDQLFHRDLPVLGEALGRPARVAQLKGRANYLCRHRLDQALTPLAPYAGDLVRPLEVVLQWARRTEAGDIGEVHGVEEGSRLWPLVTSTADNCLGSRCPRLDRCHVVAARRRAMEADIAVVNHHLLLADLALQDDGFGRLLPGADVVIVDEAHRFPEAAQSLFEVSLSARQMDDLLADTIRGAAQVGAADERLRRGMAALSEAMRMAGDAIPPAADAVALAHAPQGVTGGIGAMREALGDLCEWLSRHAELAPELGRCSERGAAMMTALTRLADSTDGADLSWVQSGRGGVSFHLTPVDTSSQLRGLVEAQPATWIFTSATLAIGDDFSFFAARIGIDSLDTFRIDSPFDYPHCARLYLPPGLPLPDSPQYTAAVIDAVAPLLQQSRGRAFLLFTSRRAVDKAAELFASREHDYTLLVQGSAPRSRLLEQFTRVERAVLLGTATFWEGVDIRGPALVVVAIDRLPFASPGDPFMQARLELVRRSGGDAFRDYQLPQAVLALRQGVGRLIRGYEDYGVVVICDPRLTTRSYGRLFMSSLPPMPVIRDLDEACSFLARREISDG